jgi:signal transduction histidine kinase
VLVRLASGELTVRDHGPGIDTGDLPFVFDRFYRALSSRSAPGAGLGLAVVREIAHGHDGDVAAEPAHGGGTLMRLTLPTCAQEIPPPGDQEITEERSGASLPRPGARVSAAAARGHSSWE